MSLDSLKLVSAVMESEDRLEAFADIEWAIRRIGDLETALRMIAEEVATATDGAHIFAVRKICKKALEN